MIVQIVEDHLMIAMPDPNLSRIEVKKANDLAIQRIEAHGTSKGN